MPVKNTNDTPDAALHIQLPVLEVISALWQRRFRLITLAATTLFAGYLGTFLIPNHYRSTLQLMPPDQQLVSSSNASMGGLGAGVAALAPMGGAGGLLNQKTPGALAIGILESRTVQDHLIQQFNLKQIYHERYNEEVRKILSKRTILEEDKKTGILSITVEDRDRYRARDMATSYVQELMTLVNILSTSSARRERIFLEQRLQGVKADLDTSSRALSQFSSHNGTFDPQKQAVTTAEAAARLQGDLIVAQSQLSSLRATLTDDNAQVRTAKARIAELQIQVDRMNGKGGDLPTTGDVQGVPSVRQIPLLGYTFYDLSRRVTIEDALYQTLTRQYELAKVQEAKEIPPIKILDEADVAEKHSSPQRSLYALGLMILSLISYALWIAAKVFWETRDESDPIKSAFRTFTVASSRDSAATAAK